MIQRGYYLQVFLWKQWLLVWKQNHYQKAFETNTLPKYVERDLNQPNSKNNFHQTMSEEASVHNKTLQKYLFQKQIQEKSPPQKIKLFSTWKTAKIEIDEIWKKGVVSSDFISSDSCHVTCYVSFLGFFGDVSSFFLVEISLRMLFS